MRLQLCGAFAARVPKASGIYEIRARRGKARYVGSTVDLNKRYRNHLFKLIKGNHPNAGLQREFARHRGILYFRILTTCPPVCLLRLEQIHLDRRKPLLNGTRTAAWHAGRS